MRKSLIVSAALSASLLLPASALSSVKLVRPTNSEAHWATVRSLGTYADALDGKLVVSPCAPRGDLSRVCRARVKGPVSQRFRVIVSISWDRAEGRMFVIRARPIT